MKEKSPGWDEVVNKYSLDRLQETIDNVEDIKNKEEISIDEARELVKDANYWIKGTAINEDGSFNEDL